MNNSPTHKQIKVELKGSEILTSKVEGSMTNSELIQTIRQARETETILTDAFLENRVPENDVIVSMKSVDILVDMAIERGLMHAPFDAI